MIGQIDMVQLLISIICCLVDSVDICTITKIVEIWKNRTFEEGAVLFSKLGSDLLLEVNEVVGI